MSFSFHLFRSIVFPNEIINLQMYMPTSTVKVNQKTCKLDVYKKTTTKKQVISNGISISTEITATQIDWLLYQDISLRL